MNFLGLKSHYFLTIKFIRLRKPIVKSLGLDIGFDFEGSGFELDFRSKPYWNSLSNSSRSCGVISDTFFPANEFLSACFSSSFIGTNFRRPFWPFPSKLSA